MQWTRKSMTRFVNYVTDVSINPTLQGARDDITSRKLQGLFLLPGVKPILLHFTNRGKASLQNNLKRPINPSKIDTK